MKYRKSTQLQFLVLGIILLVLVIIVPITGILNNNEGEKKAVGTTSYDPSSNFLQTFSGLYLVTGTTFIDPNSFSYKFHVSIVPLGSYATNDSLLSEPVVLFINGRANLLPAGQPISPQDLTITFTSGDSNKFPFEQYFDVFNTIARSNISER
jgi:hypothetical protein